MTVPLKRGLTPRKLTGRDGVSVSWKLEWRLGGTRAGERQSLTFSETKFGGDAEQLAIRAALLVEAHRYDVTRAEVAEALLGTPAEARSRIVTLNDFFYDTWWPNKTGVEPGQKSRFRSDWELHMDGSIGKLALQDIDDAAVQAWVVAMERKPAIRGGTQPKPKPGRKPKGRPRPVKPLSARTVLKHHTLLHQVLGAASRQHPLLLPQNPARGTDLPDIEHGVTRDSRVFLTREEADLVLAGFEAEWARDLAELAFETGARPSEIFAWQVCDVVRPGKIGKRGALRVQRAWKLNGRRWELVDPGPDDDETAEWQRMSLGAPKSQRSRRTITLSDRAWAVVQRRAAGKGPMELLFPNSRGGMIGHQNYVNRHWWPAVKRAQGIDPKTGMMLPREELRGRRLLTCRPTLYSTRHSHASWLIVAGWAITRVSLRLGHDSTDFTYRTYVHFIPSDDDDLDAALG